MLKLKDKYLVFIAYLLNITAGILQLFNMISLVLTLIIILVQTISVIYLSFKDLEKKEYKKYYYFLITIFLGIWTFYLLNFNLLHLVPNLDFGNILIPSVGGVPLIIGLIWIFIMLIASSFVYTFGFAKGDIRISSITTGAIITIYYYLMEPAARKLGYWSWSTGKVPIENYLVWFLLGSSIAYFGFKFNILNQIKSKWIIHFAIAQILYYSFVIIK